MTGWTTTSIAPRFLAAVLEEAHAPLDDWLAEAGVERASLVAADVAWPLPAFRDLWARAARVQPDIGLTLVDRFPTGQMHLLAHLVMRSATVGAALADLCRFAAVTSAADQLNVSTRDGLTTLTYRSRATDLDNPWMAEHYFTMVVVFMARATGRDLPVQSVEFAHAAQAPLAAYEARFGQLPRFSASRTALSFESAALHWALTTHDPYLHGILERVAQSRHMPIPDGLLEQARREIANGLLQGDAPTLTSLAEALKLSPRALRTQLSELGTPFRQLFDNVRRDLVREHLDRGLSVTETAYLLGFSEPAALQHACKRWFGKAAGEMRSASAP